MSFDNIGHIISKHHIDFQVNPYFAQLSTETILSQFMQHGQTLHLEQFIQRPDAQKVLTTYIEGYQFEKLEHLPYECIGLFLDTLQSYHIDVPCYTLMLAMCRNRDFRAKLVLYERLNENIQDDLASSSLEHMTDILFSANNLQNLEINMDLVSNISIFHDYFVQNGLSLAFKAQLGQCAQTIHYLKIEGIEWGDRWEVKEKLRIWFTHVMPSPKYATIDMFEAIVNTLNEVPIEYISKHQLDDVQEQINYFSSHEKYVLVSSKLEKMLLEKNLSSEIEADATLTKLKI